MKAHIPAAARMTRKQKEIVREYDAQVQNETFTRYLKLCGAVLHRYFGFGHDRVSEFLGKMSEEAAKAEKDEAYWKHVDDVMINELRFKDWTRENYKEVDR